jgi:hypothetical protein
VNETRNAPDLSARARRYVLVLAILVTVLLGLVVGLNRVVDPFGLYNDLSIRGINRYKTEISEYERHVQPQVIRRLQPEALMFGSSVAKIGLEPTHPGFSDQGRLPAYNFAFYGGGWGRTLCGFEYAAQTVPMKRAVVGLIPGDLPPVDCAREMPEIAEFSVAKLLASRTTLEASLSTIRKQRKGRSTHTPEGRAFFGDDSPHHEAVFRKFLAKLVSERYRGATCKLQAELPESAPAPASQIDLRGLQTLLRTAETRGVDLRLYLYPQPAQVAEFDAACGLLEKRWADIAAITAMVARYPNAQLWGFESYGPMITERIVGGQPQRWQDAVHHDVVLGSAMLDDMFGVPGAAGVGVRLTPESLPQAYAHFRARRAEALAPGGWLAEDTRRLAEDIGLPQR